LQKLIGRSDITTTKNVINKLVKTGAYGSEIKFSSMGKDTIMVEVNEKKMKRVDFLESLDKHFTKGNVVYFKKSKLSPVGHAVLAGRMYIITKTMVGSTKPLLKEELTLDSFNKMIESFKIGETVRIVIPRNNDPYNKPLFVYDDITMVKKPQGGLQKADFILVDRTNHGKCFISHKDHGRGGAESFQQYSGVSEKPERLIRRDVDDGIGTVANHPELVEFLRELRVHHEEITDKKMRFFRPIVDDELICRAVFGLRYRSTGTFNEDNCTLIAQGYPILTPYENIDSDGVPTYSLTFSVMAQPNGKTDFFKRGQYEAVFAAKYSHRRAFVVDDIEYPDVRVQIAPRRLMAGNAKLI
jgi:hypothetical protein